MHRRQLNSIEMFDVIVALFTQEEALTSTIPQVSNQYALFKQEFDSLQQQMQLQMHFNTRGYTKDKAIKRQELVNLAAEIALKVKVYARLINDQILLASVDVVKTDLRDARDERMIIQCMIVHSRAGALSTELLEFKVTAEKLNQLQQMIDQYKNLGAERNRIAVQRATATQNAARHFEQTRQRLYLLDDLVRALVDDKSFVSRYSAARKITDRVGRGPNKKKGEQGE